VNNNINKLEVITNVQYLKFFSKTLTFLENISCLEILVLL